MPKGLTADFIGHPNYGSAPLFVRFIDTSTGDITGRLWEFGDGDTSTEQHPSHSYNSPGIYNVALTVTDSRGISDAKEKPGFITVEKSEVFAGFRADPVVGAPPLAVQFTDASKGDVTDWFWDFGDGEESEVQNPLHIYTGSGTYTVRLTVTDSRFISVTKEIFNLIRVLEDAPVAGFIAEPTTGTAPLTVQFTDTSTGRITGWLWNFGDGTYVAGNDPEPHAYTVPGTYSVGLRVSGSSDLKDIELKEAYITVSAGTSGYSISGEVKGTTREETLVYLTGDEKRITETGDDDKYKFEGLQRGIYRVTPIKKGIVFDVPSREVTVTNRDIEGVDFTAGTGGLSFTSVYAEPEKVPDDGSTPVLFIAQVYHPLGGESIARVAVGLKPIGGEAEQTMYDDRTHGDEVAEDGVYSFKTFVASDTPPGPKGIHVGAVDMSGVVGFAGIDLMVIRSITDTVPKNSSQKKTIKNEIEGQTLVIGFSLSGESSSRVYRAASESSLSLQISDPDNESYGSPLSITEQDSEIQIENAGIGDWIYEIINDTSQNRPYSLSVSSAGTGVITGMVMDAETGEGIDGVSIQTNTGGLSSTDEGYYILITPSGFFTITAMTTQGNYSPSTQSASISAGESKEVNLVLSQTASDSDNDSNCIFSSVLPGAGESDQLGLLRTFRDVFLKETSAGRHYIDLYYRYSPEITLLLKKYPRFRRELKNCTMDLLPYVEGMLAGRSFRFNKEHINRIKLCLESIEANASKELRKHIVDVVKDLEENRIFKKQN